MRIRITITDTESNHVKLESDPPIEKIKEIAQSKRDTISPALAYAMNAMSVMMKASLEQSRAEGIIKIPDGILRPKFISPRRR